MRFFIKIFVLITVILVMGPFLSCGTKSLDSDLSNEIDSEESTDDLRSSLEKKAIEYYEINAESLTIIAKAFLSTDYSSITFHTDSVEIREKGLQPYEISKDELDQDLYLYYSLVDPPFHEIFRANPENDMYATTEFAMIETEYCGVSSTNITWQALLCYGDNLAQSWAIPEEYTEKISEDWMLFFNYHEGIIR